MERSGAEDSAVVSEKSTPVALLMRNAWENLLSQFDLAMRLADWRAMLFSKGISPSSH